MTDTEFAIIQLKKSKKSIYIYGNTETAQRVYKILSSQDIKITGCIVDVISNEKCSFANIPLFQSDEIINKGNVIIVIGFYQFSIAYNKIKDGFFKNNQVFILNPDCLFDIKYYQQNIEKFNQTESWLKDELSQKTFKAFLDCRMNGKTKPIYECYIPNQYFIPEIQFNKDEVFIDCGVYDGDTIEAFINNCKDYKKIIGYEPDENNIEKYNQRKFNKEKITIIKKGVWENKQTLYFDMDGTSSSKISETGKYKIEVDTIDNLDIKYPITMIKMDIEGSELSALKGASQTIKKYMPKLAICVYHKKEDLITIPQFIKSFDNEKIEYQLFLRHHSLYEHETVLYAIPNYK